MYEKYLSGLEELYKEDKKKLRTGTTLYGNLYDSRWHTIIKKPLTFDEIKSLENEVGILPNQYKELLLFTNGCYLFDLLRIAGKQDGYRGMTEEEQIYEPISLRNIQPYLGKRKLPENLFIFADSMVRGSLFAFNENNQILELNYRNLKVIETYELLDALLNEIFAEGIEMVNKKEYFEFE